MKVGIDLDGVCYDFGDAFRRYICHWAKIRQVEACPPSTRWEFYKDWGFTTQEFLMRFADGVDAGCIFETGSPLPRVKDAFEMIRSAGHSIHIITDRSIGMPGVAQKATISWLDRHELRYDSITFAVDKTVVAVDAHVDDKPENYFEMTTAGVDTYLLTQRWNQSVFGAQRVLDLYDYAERICS